MCSLFYIDEESEVKEHCAGCSEQVGGREWFQREMASCLISFDAFDGSWGMKPAVLEAEFSMRWEGSDGGAADTW